MLNKIKVTACKKCGFFFFEKKIYNCCKLCVFVYIISLMNELLNKIAPFVSLVLLGILAVFVIVNMVIGMSRGAKRAGIHLVIFVGLLVVAFLVTPFIANLVLGLDVQIVGKTPREYVDFYSNEMVKFLQQQFGDYIVPFQDYIKDYALGIVLALLNVAIFFALYFIVKIVAWIIYAIVVHFAAPKRDRDGKKNPKYAGWGLVLGALQGVCLFVLFLVPLNGVISVVNQAATYQAAKQTAEHQITTQSMGGFDFDTSDIDVNFNLDFSNFDMNSALQTVGNSLSLYNNVMKWTGLQFLSDKAFEYQLTVRMEGKEDINLVHDINSGIELYFDSQEFASVVAKLKNIYASGKIDLTSLTTKDYQILRQFINKAFDLEILNVADNLLADMDKILSTPFGEDTTKLDGTEIYEHSLYGMLIKLSATERNIAYTPVAGEPTPTNYAQYAKGLRAVVNYVADQKLNLIRNDLINVIDLVETLNSDSYNIKCEGSSEVDTFANLLADSGMDAKKYFNLATAKLENDYGDYHKGDYFINILGERLKQFSLVKMIGLKDFENLVVYNKIMDDKFTDNDDLKDMVDDLLPMFLGENAFNHYDAVNGVNVEGNWEKLGTTMLNVANVLRDYVNIVGDIDNIKADLVNDGVDPQSAQARALLEYLSDLVISKNYYDEHTAEFAGKTYSEIKFQKVDALVDALFELTHAFTPVKDFLVNQLSHMQTPGETSTYMNNLINMFSSDNKDDWTDTIESITNMAHFINESPLGDLMNNLDNFQNPENTENLAEQFIDTITEMDSGEVGELLVEILDVPEMSDMIQDTLDDMLTQVSTDEETLKDMFGEENVADVQNQISDLQTALDDYTNGNITPLEFQDAVGGLWSKVQELLNNNSNGTGNN